MRKSAIELKNLQTKITNEAYVLYEALVNLVSESAEKVTSAIETIESYFLDIEEAATEINLAGLATICQQLRQNLIQLPRLAPSKRLALIRQIERWPRLISNYFYSPSEANHQLIDFLSAAQWPQPYPLDLAKKLCDSLSQELTIDQKTNLKNPMSDLSNKIIEMSDTLSAALNQLVINDSESDTYLEALEQYTDTVQSFWEMADKIDLKGFQEICLFINDNVFELYSQPQHKKQHQELFALWPKRVLEYLQVQEIGHQNPTLDALKVHALAAEKLLELLCLDSWPIVMSKAKASLLLAQLIQDNSAFMTPINQSTEVASPTTVSSFANENVILADEPPLENEKEAFQLQIANFEVIELEDEQTEAVPSINRSSEALVYEALEDEIELETLDASDTWENIPALLPFPIHNELLVEENVTEKGELTANLAAPNKGTPEKNIEDENTFENENTYSQLSFNNDQNHKNLPAHEKDLAVSEQYLFTDDKELAVSPPPKLASVSEEEFTIAPLPVLEQEMTDNQKELPPFELLNLEKEHNSYNMKQEDFLMTSKALAADSEELVTDQFIAFEHEQLASVKEVTDQSPTFEPLASEKESAQEFKASSEKQQLKQNLPATDSNANFQFLIPKINEGENASLIEELIATEDGSEALLEAVMNYTENVQMIWEEVEQAGLFGITEVCTFINDNIMTLAGEPVSTREAARSVLSAWPQLIVAYLQAPQTGSEPLVNHLQNAGWSAPLDKSNALILKENLTAIEPRSTGVPGPTESEASKQEVMPATELEVSIPNAQLLIPKINEVAQENDQVIEELIATEDGSEALLEAVMNYTENVEMIWEAAEQAGLFGITEVCTFINDNVMVLGGEPVSVRETARSVLAEWPSKIVAYLQLPKIKADVLVDHLQNTHWPTKLDATTAESLLEKLIRVSPQITVPSLIDTTTDLAIPGVVEEDVIQLLSQDILELVCNQISDSKEGFTVAIEVCVSMENEGQAFLEAIEDYTNKVQDIWDVAEMASLAGLQEVCTFVNDNLMAFSILDKSQRLKTQTYFEKWPVEVLEYLQSPTTGAPSLVSFMQESGWPSPLEALLVPDLLTTLLTPPQQVATDATLSQQPDAVAMETSVDQPMSVIQEMPSLDLEVSGEISLGNIEVLEILISELEFAKEDLTSALNKMINHNTGESATSEALENYTEVMHRLYVASEMLGLEGLQAFCTFIIDNMTALSTQDQAHKTQAKKVLEEWPALVLAYLAKPAVSVIALINHLRQPTWAQPLTDEAAVVLFNQLIAGSTAEEDSEDENAYQRQTTAQPEDVLLTIPEDVNSELLDAYLQETPQNAGDFSLCIQNIIQNPEITEIERAQRIAHTLKGSSNILGIKAIANIAHHLEDTLEYLAKHQMVPPQELTDTMVEAADCIELMVDALLGQDDPPPQAQQVLQSVLDWANRIDKGKLDAPPRQASESAPTPATEPVKAEHKAESQANKAATDATPSTPEQVLRVPTKTIDELMRLVGELSISVGQIQERLKHVMHNTRTLTDQNLGLQQKTFELENLVDVRGITGVENRYKKTAQHEDDFDPLEFEEYNELHSVAHSFIESIVDNRELAMSIREDLVELETMFIHQDRLNKEFQNNIMTTRMVPVNSILSKLQRNVRQTCRMTGKKAELTLDGTDILIDSDVLNNLGDPLQHLLRNAIDHGIENAEERSLLGKAESGTIKLIFYREGNNIVVKCEDDGQGLNYTNIRFTAIQRGLITENQEMTEQELARLILMSGFSTKSGVTQVSGRGVGMDVVHTNIRQMKGTLDLMSKTGQGTTILIKLPMTLVTVHVLLVRVSNSRYGIPTNNLEQALAPGVGEFYQVGDEMTLKMGKNIYALKSLASLLNLPDERGKNHDNETRPIILVRQETGITAVVVDELLDTHDLVMKSMGNYVKNIHGVAGASILGDGALVPLLDLPELLRSPMQAAMSSVPELQDEQAMPTGPAVIPHIMIVDDSLSVRKSLSLLVEDAGFETLLAKDGLEAIEMMNQTRPNVMLVDMEMPRMNGLELTAHVRANQATQNLPIFMITSRTTEKHRDQAKNAGVNAYLTKPYQDTELLDLIDKALAGAIV
ncbi:MAG TPA: response regulator [Thiotrichaceae bacterium]|nr:response regulator [Thiotrichaceae bacterium]